MNRRELEELRPYLKEIGPRKFLCKISFRSIRLTATQSTIDRLQLGSAADLKRKPGNFIAEMPEGRFYECGLEAPDAMALRLALA